MKVPLEIQKLINNMGEALNMGPRHSVVQKPSPFDIPRDELMPYAEAVRIELFVVQYIKDFDACRAMQRMGYPRPTAIRESSKLLEQCYTQQLIDQVLADIPVENIVTESQVVAGLLREANFMGESANSGTRIKAWDSIAKIKGMHNHKQAVEVQHSGVMEVPMASSLNEWEDCSVNSQLKLKEDVRK